MAPFGDQIQIHRVVRATAAGDIAATIEEHQRAWSAQAAQVHARRTVTVVARAVDGVAVLRQSLQKVADRYLAAGLDLLPADDRNGGWRRQVLAGNARTGDDEFLLTCAASTGFRRGSGGLVSLATGGDGGGSIRIPAGYAGLLGMKGTFGRIPRGPHAFMRPNTVVVGNLSRSVRDAARYYDVCAGVHPFDPSSLPSEGGWEAGLGSHDLRGRKVAVVPALGGVSLDPGMEDCVRAEAKTLIASTGMVEVDLLVEPPILAAHWMMGNLSTLLADLGTRWPRCARDLTDEVAVGLHLSESLYNLHTAAAAEELRVQANEVMAAAFERVDFVIAATNPGPAFPADAATSSSEDSFIDWVKSSDLARYGFRGVLFGTRLVSAAFPRLPVGLLDRASKRFPELVKMGGLTIISNIYGNPAVSIPAGIIDGLPVGMQVLGRHHEDELLFDVALAVERERPWPMVASEITPEAN